MSNAIIAYGNVTDSVSLAGGAWNTALPLTNLKNRQISKVARSVDALAASTTFTATLVAATPIGALSIEGTNASPLAQVRWRTYSDAALTVLVYDSGTNDAYPVAPTRPTAAEIARFQKGIRHIPTSKLSAQYVKCEVFDTANADGYFQIGRLFIGDSFQPTRNMEWGASMQLRSLSSITKAINGAKFFVPRRPVFTFMFAFGELTEAEAMRVLDLQAQVDLTGEVFFIWDPDDAAYRFRKSVFGELAQLDPLQYPNYAFRSTAFQIEGVL